MKKSFSRIRNISVFGIDHYKQSHFIKTYSRLSKQSICQRFGRSSIKYTFLASSIFVRPYHTLPTQHRFTITSQLFYKVSQLSATWRRFLQDIQASLPLELGSPVLHAATPAHISFFVIDSLCLQSSPILVAYQVLRKVYTISSPMSNPTHTFGLTRRNQTTPLRQQPNGAKWASKAPVAVLIRPVENLDGPVPTHREIVERKFTTYCRLSLGHPRHAVPKKVELLRQLFTIIHDADNTATKLTVSVTPPIYQKNNLTLNTISRRFSTIMTKSTPKSDSPRAYPSK